MEQHRAIFEIAPRPQVARLDDKLDFLSRLDLIKIDVESSEYDMLLGAERTLRRFQPAIYVEEHCAFRDASKMLQNIRCRAIDSGHL